METAVGVAQEAGRVGGAVAVLGAAVLLRAEALGLRSHVTSLEGDQDRDPRALEQGQLVEHATCGAQGDQALAEIEVDDVVMPQRPGGERRAGAEASPRTTILQVELDVGGIAVGAGGEHRDVAVQAELAFGLRQSGGVAADVGRSVEDANRRRPRGGAAGR